MPNLGIRSSRASSNKIDAFAVDLPKQVVDLGAAFSGGEPAIAQRLKGIADQNRNYLANEYFNLDWDIMKVFRRRPVCLTTRS